MSNQADQNDEETTTSPFKAMLVVVGILGLVFSIFTLLPMFFTLLSDGDFRAPAEIHPTDTAARANSQNHSTKSYETYNPEPLTKKSGGSSQADAYLQKPPKKFSNTLPMN
jgi:hypothetical protein